MNDDALDALAVLEAFDEGTGYVLPRQPYGGWFRIALKKAEISKDLTFHCLRHTFGSRLVDAGKDIRTIAELMGHKDLKMTMRYTHPAPEHRRYAVAGIATKKAVSPTVSEPDPNGILIASSSL